MLHIPHQGDWNWITNYATTGSGTPGTSVTTGAASATKGTVAELVSAANNTQDSWGIYVMASNYAVAASASDGMLDILVGGATDDVLIPNLMMGYCPENAAGFRQWFFPLHIPAGLRVAAQAAGLRTSTAMRVGVYLMGGAPPPWRVGSRVTTYGVGTVPNGTTLTVAASGGAASATQITASTSEDHFAFLPDIQVANDTTIATATSMAVSIGVGASTEENIGTWLVGKNANESMFGPFPALPVFRDVPSASRLTLLCSNGGANDAGYTGVIYAVS